MKYVVTHLQGGRLQERSIVAHTVLDVKRKARRLHIVSILPAQAAQALK